MPGKCSMLMQSERPILLPLLNTDSGPDFVRLADLAKSGGLEDWMKYFSA